MKSFLSSGKGWALPGAALGLKGAGGGRNEEPSTSWPPTCPAVNVTAASSLRPRARSHPGRAAARLCSFRAPSETESLPAMPAQSSSVKCRLPWGELHLV